MMNELRSLLLTSDGRLSKLEQPDSSIADLSNQIKEMLRQLKEAEAEMWKAQADVQSLKHQLQASQKNETNIEARLKKAETLHLSALDELRRKLETAQRNALMYSKEADVLKAERDGKEQRVNEVNNAARTAERKHIEREKELGEKVEKGTC